MYRWCKNKTTNIELNDIVGLGGKTTPDVSLLKKLSISPQNKIKTTQYTSCRILPCICATMLSYLYSIPRPMRRKW